MQISATLQDQFADAITTACGATCFARFYSAAYADNLASAGCNNPVAPAASTGVVTLDVGTAVEDTSAAGGAAACALLAFYEDSTAAATAFIFALGVAATGTPDVDMANTTIGAGDTVQIASLTWTVPTGSPTV